MASGDGKEARGSSWLLGASVLLSAAEAHESAGRHEQGQQYRASAAAILRLVASSTGGPILNLVSTSGD